MKGKRLLVDVAPLVLFLLALSVFAVGWVRTDQVVFLIAALLMVLAAAYTVYRVRNLYIK